VFSELLSVDLFLDESSDVDEESNPDDTTCENTMLVCGFQIEVDFNEENTCLYVAVH
jgi:hypothetical protein